MKLSTALKISGVCGLALMAEALMAYLIFSNYAFSLADSGQYRIPEAYSTGPMANVARVFYILFGVTVGIGAGAPLLSILIQAVRAVKRSV